MSLSTNLEVSAIDTERFGVRIARGYIETQEAIEEVTDFCRENDIQMFIARCPTTETKTVQQMERHHYLLMDTLIYYRRKLTKEPLPEDKSSIAVRGSKVEEADSVQEIARQSFQGYFGHYHADERLDRTQCDDAYLSWARNSVIDRNVADHVLVAEEDENLLGFATLRLNTSEEGEGVLFGVSPEAQGRGIYRSFMINGMHWCAAQGTTSMVVSTQIVNIAVQKVWARLGFEASHSYYTFHRWFDES